MGRSPRPATRIGRTVIFEGGNSRVLGIFEFLAVVAKLKKNVRR